MLTAITGGDRRVPLDETYDFVESSHIRVIVGSGEGTKQFIVHETLITQASDFFKMAMAGHWKESEQRTVPLPEDEPEVLSLYLKFLYTRVLPVKTATDDEEETRKQYLLLSKLYVLAEKLLDETTKNTVLDALSACAQETNFATLPNHESACVLYDGTTDFSPAREWLVDMYTEHGMPDSLGLMASSYPGEFLADLAVTMLSERAKPHVHEEVMKEALNVQRLNIELDSLRSKYERKQEKMDSMTRTCSEHQQRLKSAESEIKQLKNQVKQLKR